MLKEFTSEVTVNTGSITSLIECNYRPLSIHTYKWGKILELQIRHLR